MTSPVDDIIEAPTDRSIEIKVRDFGDLLSTISSIDEKKRKLWKEVYENAIADRQNCYVMFTRLVRITGDKSPEHAVHGKTIATYIAGMQKSNEQLLKLAELVSRAQENTENLNPDDMFAQLEQQNKGR